MAAKASFSIGNSATARNLTSHISNQIFDVFSRQNTSTLSETDTSIQAFSNFRLTQSRFDCGEKFSLRVNQSTNLTTIVYLKFDSATQQATETDLKRTLSQDARLQAYAKAGGVSPPTALVSVDGSLLNSSETENVSTSEEFLQSFITNVTDSSFKTFVDSSAKMSTNTEIDSILVKAAGNCDIEIDQLIGLRMQVQEMMSIFTTQMDKSITETATKQTSDLKATSDSSQGSGNLSGDGSGGSGAIAGVVGGVVGLVVLIGVGFFVFRYFSSTKGGKDRSRRRRRRKSRSSSKRDNDDDDDDDDDDGDEVEEEEEDEDEDDDNERSS